MADRVTVAYPTAAAGAFMAAVASKPRSLNVASRRAPGADTCPCIPRSMVTAASPAPKHRMTRRQPPRNGFLHRARVWFATHGIRNVHYNYHRPHTAVGNHPPAARLHSGVTHVMASYTWGLSGGPCRRRGAWHALPQRGYPQRRCRRLPTPPHSTSLERGDPHRVDALLRLAAGPTEHRSPASMRRRLFPAT